MAFTSDRRLITCGADANVKLWNRLSNGQPEWIGPPYIFGHMAVSPRTGGIALVSLDHTLWAGRIGNSGTWQRREGQKRPFERVALTLDGRLLAAGTRDGEIWLFDLRDLNTIKSFQYGNYVNGIAFSADGRLLAATGNGKSTCVWHVHDAQLLYRFGHSGHGNCVVFSPDLRYLACGGRFREIQTYSMNDNETLVCSLGVNATTSALSWNHDASLIASGHEDGGILLWDVNTATIVAEMRGHRTAVLGLQFSPDGKTLASAGGSTVRLWHVGTGRDLGVLYDRAPVNDVAFVHDGKWLLASHGDIGPIASPDILVWKCRDSQPNSPGSDIARALP
jgi:WD40 repeat protein